MVLGVFWCAVVVFTKILVWNAFKSSDSQTGEMYRSKLQSVRAVKPGRSTDKSAHIAALPPILFSLSTRALCISPSSTTWAYDRYLSIVNGLTVFFDKKMDANIYLESLLERSISFKKTTVSIKSYETCLIRKRQLFHPCVLKSFCLKSET